MGYNGGMQKNSAIFIQGVFMFVAIGAFAFLLWEPHIEGRNAEATFFEIYFKDPFLAYAYIASTPFFMALYQTFKIFGYIRQSQMFSREIITALRVIRYCALVMIGFAIMGEVFIFQMESDDRAGGVFMGLIVILGSLVVFATAAMLERRANDLLT